MPNSPHFGALPHQWASLILGCGVTADLLPVVSNPTAPISPTSEMKFRGKTPSLYNQRRQVVGISNWTTYTADSEDTESWQREPDYGICIQTRKLRALDLDVDDPKEVKAIEKFVHAVLPDVPLAIRRRPNSHKCLIAFEVTELPEDQDLYKRTVRTAHGMIEFLATGQQFIAYGTHPSGVRYTWENEGEFPEIPLHTFESLWQRLCGRFGVGEPTSSAARKRGAVLAGVTDRLVNQLEDKGLVLGWGKDGQAHIECPYKAEHTMDSGLSQTSYFPAGTGGYQLGHFKCLHAHCAHRTDQDFMTTLGLHCMDPAALVAISEGDPESINDAPILPAFRRHETTGRVLATAKNIDIALSAPHACGFHIARDTFLEEVMLRPYNTAGGGEWRRLVDEDYIELRITLEALLSFEPLPTGTLREVLHAVARRSQFDSASEFIKSLQWDGTPRVDRFFTDYIKTSDEKFGRAVARYLFTALAGRAMHAGIKADMVPILISGEQGLLKTSAIEALAPIPDVFVDFNLAVDDAQRVRLIKGKLVAEIGEMRGLWGSQIEDVKAFITRRNDHWVPKYKEQAIHYPRRCVFIGTGNNHDILNDPTGTRRFLPMTVVAPIDVEKIREDCLQLWAEGRVLYEQAGVAWQDAQGLGRDNNVPYTTEDPWVELVREWLGTVDMDNKTIIQKRGGVSTAEVLVLGLGHNKQSVNSGVGKRVAEVMRVLGYHRDAGGVLWFPPVAASATVSSTPS